MQTLNTPSLRNAVLPPPLEIVGEPEEVNEFVGVGTYIAVAAPKSTETVRVVDPFWIIKVQEVNRIDMDEESVDSFGSKIPPKMMHLSGYFLEKNQGTQQGRKWRLTYQAKSHTSIRTSFCLYPYVNIKRVNVVWS